AWQPSLSSRHMSGLSPHYLSEDLRLQQVLGLAQSLPSSLVGQGPVFQKSSCCLHYLNPDYISRFWCPSSRWPLPSGSSFRYLPNNQTVSTKGTHHGKEKHPIADIRIQ